MHGEAPPPFDGEEARLETKTMRKMIYRYIIMIAWDIPGQSVAILDVSHMTSELHMQSMLQVQRSYYIRHVQQKELALESIHLSLFLCYHICILSTMYLCICSQVIWQLLVSLDLQPTLSACSMYMYMYVCCDLSSVIYTYVQSANVCLGVVVTQGLTMTQSYKSLSHAPL